MKSNKVVVITGASAGMGADMAREYAKKGYDLVLSARRLDRLEKLKTEIETQYKNVTVLPVACDVTSDEDVKNLFNQARSKFPTIDMVVANAGFGVRGTIENLELEDYRRQFETNIFGVLRTVKESTEDIKKSQGSFIILGSGMSYLSIPGQSAYTMSKFAIRTFSEALRYELKKFNVSVTLVCPGLIATDFQKVDRQGNYGDQQNDFSPGLITMSSPVAARKIVRGSLRKKKEIHLTAFSAMGVWIERHMPCVVRFFMGITTGKTLEIAAAQNSGLPSPQ